MVPTADRTPSLAASVGQDRLPTPQNSNHPLSPHSLSLYPTTSRRSPSIFTIPLDEAGPPGYFGYDPPTSSVSRSETRVETDAHHAELLGEGSSRSSPRKTGLGGRSGGRGSLALESLGREEMELVHRRCDLMGDEEIRKLLEEWEAQGSGTGRGDEEAEGGEPDGSAASSTPIPTTSVPIPIPKSSPSKLAASTLSAELSDGSEATPLFPPSPPSHVSAFDGPHPTLRKTDHPLRVLARAVLELQETVARLQAENDELRRDISAEAGRRRSAGAVTIHDDLTEAISTSLTSDPPIPSNQSGRFPDPPRVPSPVPSSSSRRPQSVRSHHRDTASVRSVDMRSGPSTGTAAPSSRSVRSVDMDTSSPGKSPVQPRKRDAARASWTSSLWGWGASGSGTVKKGVGRDRKGSISSLRGEIKGDDVAVLVGEEEEDEHAWRKGDGGSSPAFRAVFLATRIVTPDPSSILSSPHIVPSSLTARLAHSLVSHARDQGVVARDPPNTRRRLSKETRSRAASILSEESQSAGEMREKTYGETLAATALYGRSLLSSVSGATIRAGGRNKAHSILGNGDETVRPPSLLGRTSARTFPTTALSPSAAAADGSSGRPEIGADETPLPSVEMASITAGENQPPTVLLSRQNLGLYFQSGKSRGRTVETASRFKGVDPPLTDRYGFIYDIQHASMLKDASAAGVPAPASLSGIVPTTKEVEEGEGWIERRRRASHEPVRPDIGTRRSTGSSPSPSTATPSIETPSTDSSGVSTPSRAPSSSRVPLPSASEPRHRSSTLISLNPSPARPVTAKDTLTVSARGASSLRSVASPLLDPPSSSPEPTSAAVSRATISSLLDQLTELHDRQQAERKVEWDAWLAKRKRKTSAKKAKGETGWGGDMIGISQMGLGEAEEWRAFAKLVRHGIPLAYRSDVWAECSGAKDALLPGEYREILAVHAEDKSPVLGEIEKDVSRTFPGNLFFGGDGPGVAKLRRVLVAYSWRNPRVGYCQGMNMLAATLLLTHTDEEQAFWVLAAMIDRLLPTDFYSPSLLASRADQAVLAELVEVHLPRISATLSELGVDLASITFGWFLSLFTDCLPVETLFRVWDVFFVEGHDTLFRVALAILKLNEVEICAAESAGELFAFVGGMTSRLWAADKLISTQHGYRPLVRHADIASRYGRHLAALQEA